MYFLIGLGIIVIIVYGNMLYDRIKTNKNKDTTDVEKSAGTADNHFAEQKETKGQKTEINRQAPDQDQSGRTSKRAESRSPWRGDQETVRFDGSGRLGDGSVPNSV